MVKHIEKTMNMQWKRGPAGLLITPPITPLKGHYADIIAFRSNRHSPQRLTESIDQQSQFISIPKPGSPEDTTDINLNHSIRLSKEK